MATVDGRYTVIATIPTGLEQCAAGECSEMVGGAVSSAQRGSISCTLERMEDLKLFDGLRSIDNYQALVGTLPHFCKDESTVLERLESLPFDGLLDWTAALQLWQYHRDNFDSNPISTPIGSKGIGNDVARMDIEESDVPVSEEIELERKVQEEKKEDVEKEEEGEKEDRGSTTNSSLLKKKELTFRVTCTRSGRKHSFSSPEAARCFGAGLARYFNWKVKLKDPDIEVLLAISDDEVRVGVAITRESKFKRNIAHFGPTTLRATIAYGMLRCADIKPGDVVVDPLCGGGSIGIEGSLAWPGTYHIAGDIHDLAMPRAAANINSLIEELDQNKLPNCLKVDLCQWDVCRLPLRTASIDVIVTDLPFGKKSGSKHANWELYPRALKEMARVSRPETGRAVLLTHDNKALSRSLQKDVFWKRIKTLWLNVGGLQTALYMLRRSSRLFT